MSRKLIVALMAACVVFVGASYAAVENIKVSGDIAATAIQRDLSLGETANGSLDVENFALSQVRLRVDADLTEGVSTVVRMINERTWGSEDLFNVVDTAGTGGDTEIDLDLAYVELKEFLYQPLTLIVGRQNLRYGNGLVIGDPDTNQTVSVKGDQEFGDLSLRKSFDAVRAILDYSPYTLDVLYAKVSEGATNINDDRNMWGLYGTYDWASYNGVTEGYFLYLNEDRDNIGGSALSTPVLTQLAENQSQTYVVGGRLQYDPNDKWTLGVEGAYQFGDVQILDAGAGLAFSPYQHLSAFAGQLIAQYRFLNDYKSMMQLEYTYLSGDDDITDKAQNAWQPVFEDQTPGEIINILFPQSSTQCVTLRGSTMPREDITLGASYTWLILSEKWDYPLTPQYNSLVGPASGNTYQIDSDEIYLGSEVDSYMLYDYTEDVQLKLTGAWFIPGGWFEDANDSLAYSVKAGVSVDF